MANAYRGGSGSRGGKGALASLHGEAIEEDRCRRIGIRCPAEREFGYYKFRVEVDAWDVALNEDNHRNNVVLAMRYPLGALEWAKDDDDFQRFLRSAAGDGIRG